MAMPIIGYRCAMLKQEDYERIERKIIEDIHNGVVLVLPAMCELLGVINDDGTFTQNVSGFKANG